MRVDLRLLIACLALAGAATAGSFEDAMASAATLLAENNAAGALEAYQELLVDHPDSEAVLMGVGCAQYAKAAAPAPDGSSDPAAYEEARATFDRLVTAKDEEIRAAAAFNRANCLAQAAKRISEDKYEQSVTQLKNAAQAYEALLDEFPDHAKARQNLDHVRYLIKEKLYNPPPEQEQEKEDENKEDPPTVITQFDENPETDIEGAEAEAHENVVELVMPKEATLSL